jgi:hypothetical protein
MKKHVYPALAILALAALAQAADPPKAEEKAPGTLKVKLNYTGAGKVDDKHKIFIFVFDSPNFSTDGSMPIGGGAASAKDGTVELASLSKSPVFVVAAYDPKGEYDGMSGPPPSGASVAMYGKTPGTADPIKIEPKQTVQVDMPFDDTAKMP